MTPNDAATSVHLALPEDFRRDDFLAFHGRDGEGLAERVGRLGVAKGLMLDGRAARLDLFWREGQVGVSLSGAEIAPEALTALARRLLGLDQDVAGFEARCGDDPLLGPLIRARPGLRVPQSATPFEALAWAILGQQISVAAAIGLRRRLIRASARWAPGDLLAFPDAAAVHALGEAKLGAAGLSRAKAGALMRLSAAVLDDELPLDDWAAVPDPERIRAALVAIKGIGPWTVNYALLRGFGWLDGSLHGDVAVRRNLGALLGRATAPDAAFTEAWLAPFSPWRALVAAHLWARDSAAGY